MRIGRRPTAAMFAAMLCALFAVWSATADAASQHVFDAGLSLEGDCTPSVDDPIADPDCPGGTHPPKAFSNVCGLATDVKGYIYVASAGTPIMDEARIDVFDPEGHFITEIGGLDEGGKAIVQEQSCRIDVDSQGRIYVPARSGTAMTFRYTPESYPPPAGVDVYEKEPFVVNGLAVAVDPTNDHVYIATPSVSEYAPDGTLVESSFASGEDIDVWHRNGNHAIYINAPDGSGNREIQIYDGATYALEDTVEDFSEDTAQYPYASLAVDQESGDIYVGDLELNKRVNHLGKTDEPGECSDPSLEPLPSESGEWSCITEIEHNFRNANEVSDITVDGSTESPNEGYVFISSGVMANGHAYAFSPPLEVAAPEVSEQAVSQVSTTGAKLEGSINPNGAETSYRFEFGTADCSVSDCESIPIPDGVIPGNAPTTVVTEVISSLSPGTTYHFRLLATNHCKAPIEPEVECPVEGPDTTFTTYAAPASASCPNAALRTENNSGQLPDCRAYELVSPSDSDGKLPAWSPPTGSFDALLATASGNSLMFTSESGALPGDEGNGYRDAYRSRRGSAAWEVISVGPSALQARLPGPLSLSPDHDYSFWEVQDPYGGELARPGGGTFVTNYVRHPDGSYVLVGAADPGFEDDDATAEPLRITAGAGHIIFRSPRRLKSDAPATGLIGIYDQTLSGLHTVSLLPGDITPVASASFEGASTNGTDVVFVVGSTMYERLDNSMTVPITEGAAAFAGISDDGGRVFYIKEGNIFLCETGSTGCVGPGSNTPIPIGSGGESEPINVSLDGSHVYFVSPKQLDGSNGILGEANLYVWDTTSEAVRFIATLDSADISGEVNLLRWLPNGAMRRGSAFDPSRTTPDGKVLVFESHADLTPPFVSNGHSQVYRYDAEADELICVSCNPTEIPATADSRLQSLNLPEKESFAPTAPTTPIVNVTDDGDTVFFESGERLVVGDTDGLSDVYRWQAPESRECPKGGGCLGLISSGRSAGRSNPDYLYAVSPSGDDVFVHTADTLSSHDTDGGVPSIYDARVGGGFPVPVPVEECQGDACQGSPGSAPPAVEPPSAALRGQGNVKPGKPKPCRKGKRRVVRRGKARCVGKRAGAGKRHNKNGTRGTGSR
jgi:hypothetical protein